MEEPKSGTQGLVRRMAPSLIAVLVVGAILAVVLGSFIGNYRLFGDDFPVVLNSSSQYISGNDWTEWFTSGYSTYFHNYLDWQPIATDFVRPIANLSFFLMGLLEPAGGDPVYLLFNYAAVLSSVFLVALILQSYGKASRWVAGALAVAFGLSTVWHPALLEAASLTNAVALALVLGALVALDAPSGPASRLRLGVAVTLLTLAVGTHETAAVAPFVCAALLVAVGPERPRWTHLAALGIPVVSLVVMRLWMQSTLGAYPLQSMSQVSVDRRFTGLSRAFAVPFDYWRWIDAPGGDAYRIGGIIAMVASALLVFSIVRYARRKPLLRAVAMWAAILMSLVPGFLASGEPRFMGFASVIWLIAALWFISGNSRWLGPALVAAVMAASVVLFTAGVVLERDDVIARSERSGALVDTMKSGIAANEPDQVILVTDNVGMFGASGMIQFAANPRTTVMGVVLSNYEGGPDPEAQLNIYPNGDNLVTEVAYGPSQTVSFLGAFYDMTVPNRGFVYSPFIDPTLPAFRAEGPMRQGSTLVVGVHPKTGEAYALPF